MKTVFSHSQDFVHCKYYVGGGIVVCFLVNFGTAYRGDPEIILVCVLLSSRAVLL